MSLDVIPESHRDILDKPAIAHLATIGPDGEPQSHPLWFDVEGDAIVFSTTDDRQKYRNIERDNRVSLSILDPDNPYRYVEVRGRVEITDDEDKSFIDDLAKRYLGKDEYPMKDPDLTRKKFHVKPEHAATMG